MSKKELLASAVVRLGLLRHVSVLQGKGLVVLAYHRIRASESTHETVFDEGVFGPTQESFDQQVRWLKQNFEVLSEAEILEAVGSRKPYKHRCAAITFDDGYRDNYTLALPVLRRHSVPGIFFICPGLIDARRLGWWDLIAYLVKSSKRPHGSVAGETMTFGAEAHATIDKLHSRMKLRSHAETANLIPELAAACEVALPEAGLQSDQLMSWEQIREAAGAGIAIGSHTHTHSVLTTLDETAQRAQLTESKTVLEERLGSRVRTIAYPAGCYGLFSAETMRIARECGYEGAFSFRTGGNDRWNASPYNIRRIAASDHFDPSFTCSVSMPKVFTWSVNTPPPEIAAAEAL